MAGKQRPRHFIALDVDFYGQDTIQDLIAKFRAAGPAAFLEIVLAAKAAALGGMPAAEHGTVELRYAVLARRTGLADAQEARHIVDYCVELGLLARADGPSDPERFT